MKSELRRRLGTRPKSRKDRRAFGTVWPNGEFTLSWPEVREDASDWSSEIKETPWTGKQLVRRSHLASLCSDIHTSECYCPQRPPRPKRGLKGISQYGKRFVRSAAALMQRKYSRFRLSFLTLTLPELSKEQMEVLGPRWGQAVNRFHQWLLRRLTRSGLPRLVVSVTELQPKRLQSGSLSVLHLHVLFVGRPSRSGAWCLSPVEVRRAWLRVLGNILKTNLVSDACEELKMVKSSAEGYLGKYMSKGKDDVAKFIALGGEDYVPGQWWATSKEVRDWVKSETMRGADVGAALERLIDYALAVGAKAGGLYLRPVILDLDGFPWFLAWVGRMGEKPREWIGAQIKEPRRLVEWFVDRRGIIA